MSWWHSKVDLVPHWFMDREDRVQEALIRLGRVHEEIYLHKRGTFMLNKNKRKVWLLGLYLEN